MAAAVPYEENRCCCAKHVQQRELAEAEGQTFSRATADTLDVYQCVGQVCLYAHTCLCADTAGGLLAACHRWPTCMRHMPCCDKAVQRGGEGGA